MSIDPNAQMDETVLDLIERSPTGAVPHTPAYVDALNRLHAAQKIYHSADHKDGHVTARSLAALPHFVAANLADLAAGRIGAEALEPNAEIFTRYVKSLPVPLQARAETYRLKVAGKPAHHRHKAGDAPAIHDPLHTLFIVPGTGPNRGLPGNYLHGMILEAGPAVWTLQVHDCDDGLAVYDAPSLAEAAGHVEEIIASAPFHLSELAALGFQMR